MTKAALRQIWLLRMATQRSCKHYYRDVSCAVALRNNVVAAASKCTTVLRSAKSVIGSLDTTSNA